MKSPDTTSPTHKRCSCPTCASAGILLPIREFGANKQAPDGYHWYCKACNNAKQREWKRQNAEKVKRWRKDWKHQRAKQMKLELT